MWQRRSRDSQGGALVDGNGKRRHRAHAVRWTSGDDELLRQAIVKYGMDGNWSEKAEMVGKGKTADQVYQHWHRVLCCTRTPLTAAEKAGILLMIQIWRDAKHWTDMGRILGKVTGTPRTGIQVRSKWFDLVSKFPSSSSASPSSSLSSNSSSSPANRECDEILSKLCKQVARNLKASDTSSSSSAMSLQSQQEELEHVKCVCRVFLTAAEVDAIETEVNRLIRRDQVQQHHQRQPSSTTVSSSSSLLMSSTGTIADALSLPLSLSVSVLPWGGSDGDPYSASPVYRPTPPPTTGTTAMGYETARCSVASVSTLCDELPRTSSSMTMLPYSMLNLLMDDHYMHMLFPSSTRSQSQLPSVSEMQSPMENAGLQIDWQCTDSSSFVLQQTMLDNVVLRMTCDHQVSFS
eukprot:ANDGO_00319.mRNA.1 hypothetical protein